MARRVASAEIFAAPALYEPFGLAVLEAAAAGCVLVLGDIPSLRENWSGAAIFVDSKDPAALRATINALIANPQERTRLAATARDRAHRFTLDRMALAYAALYRDMMRTSIRLETA
jgi:glycosyltransferase involved in cell wall biosynthesis